MPKVRKLDPDHFNKPPVQSMRTSEQKFIYEGLRAFSDDEGILEDNSRFLALRILGSDRRWKHFLSNLSALEKLGAIVRYESEGKQYIVLPFHFEHEDPIQYFSPTIHPKPPREFYVRFPHYSRRLIFYIEKTQRSAEGGRLPSDTLCTTQGGSGSARGGLGRPEGPRGGTEKLDLVIDRILRERADVNVKRYRNSDETLKDVVGKETLVGKGMNEKKRESPKGEKGASGEREITLQRILNICGDKQSANFYKLVLARCPQEMVRSVLVETKCCIDEEKIKKSPGAYFTGLIKKLAAKERISLDGSTALRR